MATTVYTTEDILLSDGSQVTLKPLNIKNLRAFMKKIDEFGNAKTEEDGLEVLLDAGALCLKDQRPEFWDETKTKSVEEEGVAKTVPAPGHSEAFEDVLDMETVYKVLEVCGGVKLNDPNLLRAAAEALGTPSTSQN